MNILNILKFIGDKIPKYKVEDFGGGIHKIKGEGGLRNKDGKKIGEWISYSRVTQESSIKTVENYVDGKKHGLHQKFWTNGTLKEVGNYVDDVRDGVWQTFHSNGEPWQKATFRMGKPVFNFEKQNDNN